MGQEQATSKQHQRLLLGLFVEAHPQPGLHEWAPYLAQIRRNNGWRGLAGTEPKIIAGRRDGTPHHVTVHVDATYNRRHHRWEGRGIARRAIEGVRRQ